MGLLPKRFTATNPSAEWRENPLVPLEVDLDRHRLGPVALGDPIEKLSFLGPGRRSGADKSWVEYPMKGLTFGAKDAALDWFTVFLQPSPAARFGAFRGRLKFRGSPLAPAAFASEPEAVRLFGEPYWRDADEDEALLFYEFGPVEWQLEVAPSGAVTALTVSPPLLADPEQRAFYKVSKPWPPPQAAG